MSTDFCNNNVFLYAQTRKIYFNDGIMKGNNSTLNILTCGACRS